VSNFNKTRAFLKRFSKNTQIPNFIKICTVGAEWLQRGWTKRRTERHDGADSRFSQLFERGFKACVFFTTLLRYF